MNKIIKNVLTTIEKKGYEAYVVGGYVRDLLVGKASFDVDICTNATPKELITIFPKANPKNLGGISFKIKEYNFEITTYREEIKYANRKPLEYNYINNLIIDLNRRDFTINAICMNKRGEIIDLLKGIEDLNNLTIRMIGDIETKITEDPLRIMRAIRIATNTNFTIEPNLYNALKKHHPDILKLSSTRIKEELTKILISPNVKYGLKLLNETGIAKILGLEYEDIVPVKNMEGMYAQISLTYEIPFTKVEKNNIKIIKSILQAKEITPEIVYKYGLYFSKLGGAILNIDQNYINKIYKNLPIKALQELAITPNDIKTLNINSKKISTILSELEILIISGKIKNKKSDLIKYIKENRTRWIS